VNSELLIGGISAGNKKRSSVQIVLPILAFLLLLTCIALVWMYKYRGRVMIVLFTLKYYYISGRFR
jgi:preprotein translocase subunit SecG